MQDVVYATVCKQEQGEPQFARCFAGVRHSNSVVHEEVEHEEAEHADGMLFQEKALRKSSSSHVCTTLIQLGHGHLYHRRRLSLLHSQLICAGTPAQE